MPSNQESGIMPQSKTRLKKATYVGSMISVVFLIYSLMILSFAELLLFFSCFMHFKISASVMNEFNSSSSSVVSIFIFTSSLAS